MPLRGGAGGVWCFSPLKNLEVSPPQGSPNQLLSKFAFHLIPARVCEFPCQRLVFDEPGYGIRKRGNISHWKREAGLTIHQQVDDAGRRRSDHRFASRMCFQNNCGQPFAVARQNQNISHGIVGSGVVHGPCQNDAITRLEAFANVLGKRVTVLKAAYQEQAKIWDSILKLQEGFHEFGNTLVAGQASNEKSYWSISWDSELTPQFCSSPCSLWRWRETRDIHTIATSSPKYQRPLSIHETAGDGLFSHAMADANDAMGKTARQALGQDQEFASQTSGGLKAQAVKGVKAARNTIQPRRKTAEKSCLGCAHIGDGGAQCPQDAP